MQTFKVKRWEHQESQPESSGQRSGILGFRAPGSIVLVLQEGSGWILDPDGDRRVIAAKTVVTWDAGEWVEYGGGGEIEVYWADDLSDKEWTARLAHVFGPEAIGQ